EKKAYSAYLLLKEDLQSNDGIEIELDSARRSVAAQKDIMARFIEKYGPEYAAKTVATPGYSEHHTGLALDLYFRLDGKDVYYNEDMVKYPEVWRKYTPNSPNTASFFAILRGKRI
ncbi:MAG: D-alanyl-D-alanine carboxypeptidase family protein, partial [Synergistaceae bacterium]|nr:D-alanyl-D-alanine carboxypeptidase family protein [Synergistaceae bacterium]